MFIFLLVTPIKGEKMSLVRTIVIVKILLWNLKRLSMRSWKSGNACLRSTLFLYSSFLCLLSLSHSTKQENFKTFLNIYIHPHMYIGSVGGQGYLPRGRGEIDTEKYTCTGSWNVLLNGSLHAICVKILSPAYMIPVSPFSLMYKV